MIVLEDQIIFLASLLNDSKLLLRKFDGFSSMFCGISTKSTNCSMIFLSETVFSLDKVDCLFFILEYIFNIEKNAFIFVEPKPFDSK